MKLSYIIFYFLGVAFSSSTFAETKSEMYDYKCYLETSIGFRIAFYEWPKNGVQARMESLIAKRVRLPAETIRPFIKEVIECVEMDKNFSLTIANEFDEKTAK